MENPANVGYAPSPVETVRVPGVDWAAILAGAVLAAAVGLVLNAFGAALGLSTISAERGEGSVNVWLIVTAFWMLVTMILTYMAGGYVAGRMRRRGDGLTADEVNVRDGVHGLVVWALGTIAMAWIALSLLGSVAATVGNVAGAAVQGAGTALASGVEAAGQAVAGQASSGEDGSSPMNWISDRLTRPSASAFGPAEGGIDPAELTRQSAAILAEVAATGEISEEDRSFLTAATVRVSGVTPEVAEARTEAAVTAAQALRAEAESAAATAEATARAAAETARKSAILTAFLVAAASLASAAAAVAGAVHGGHHRDENRFFAGLGFRR
jgi:hypothetical protein